MHEINQFPTRTGRPHASIYGKLGAGLGWVGCFWEGRCRTKNALSDGYLPRRSLSLMVDAEVFFPCDSIRNPSGMEPCFSATSTKQTSPQHRHRHAGLFLLKNRIVQNAKLAPGRNRNGCFVKKRGLKGIPLFCAKGHFGILQLPYVCQRDSENEATEPTILKQKVKAFM